MVLNNKKINKIKNYGVHFIIQINNESIKILTNIQNK